MTHELPLGRAIRRFRRLNGVKQAHLAELLNVSQGTLSRWESGTHRPDGAHRGRLEDMMARAAGGDADRALLRLVSSSRLDVHLVCDATHRLLAASPSRVASWTPEAHSLLGQSLWPFATPEIRAAEGRLGGMGWFDRPFQTLEFHTGGNDSEVLPVLPGLTRWETVPLADGRTGRLTTTVHGSE